MPNLLGVSYRRIDARTGAFVDTWPRAITGMCVLWVALQGTWSGMARAAVSNGERTSHNVATSTILLVRSAGDERIMAAVRAEIDNQRFTIVEVRAVAERSKSLTTLMSEMGAAAAIRYNARQARIELSAALDSGSVEDVLRKDDASGDVEILALRTAETLRAHGLDLGPYPPSANPSERMPASPAPVTTRRPSPPTTSTHEVRNTSSDLDATISRAESPLGNEVWIELAPGLLTSSGGWSSVPITSVALRLQLNRDFSVSAIGLVPFVSQTITAAEGSAKVDTYLVGGTLSTTLLRHRVFASTFGLGASMVITQMQGDARPGYRGAHEIVITQAPHLSLGISVALHERWLLVSSLLGGVSIPRVSVLFADRPERSWGSPFAAIGVGLAARVVPW